MIDFQVTGDKELIGKLQHLPADMRASLLRKINELSIRLEAHIKADKLSGNPLHVRSGDLRDSITHEVTQSGSSIEGKVFSSGNIPYAAIHEYGGIIHHPGGTPYFIEGLTGMAVFVSIAAALNRNLPVTRAHDIPIPERSYMRTGLADMKTAIIDGMSEAVGEAARR